MKAPTLTAFDARLIWAVIVKVCRLICIPEHETHIPAKELLADDPEFIDTEVEFITRFVPAPVLITTEPLVDTTRVTEMVNPATPISEEPVL